MVRAGDLLPLLPRRERRRRGAARARRALRRCCRPRRRRRARGGRAGRSDPLEEGAYELEPRAHADQRPGRGWRRLWADASILRAHLYRAHAGRYRLGIAHTSLEPRHTLCVARSGASGSRRPRRRSGSSLLENGRHARKYQLSARHIGQAGGRQERTTAPYPHSRQRSSIVAAASADALGRERGSVSGALLEPAAGWAPEHAGGSAGPAESSVSPRTGNFSGLHDPFRRPLLKAVSPSARLPGAGNG